MTDFFKTVSLGMMVVGAVPYLRGCLIIIAQILGGIASAAVVSCLLPGPLNVRTTLGGGTSVVQGLFIEVC
jgi:aquaporin related protein